MQNGNNAIAIQENEGQLLMFHDPEENTDIQVKMLDETVWLTQEQMSILFHKATSTISEHIKNIYKEGELQTISTVRKIRIVQNEGGHDVEREINHYNLDIGRLLIFLRRARIIILILKLLITFLRRFKINSIECQVTVLSKGDMPA